MLVVIKMIKHIKKEDGFDKNNFIFPPSVKSMLN